MKKNILLAIVTLLTIYISKVFANTLMSEAETRGINSACLSHLTQLDVFYDFDGLNITFAHPTDPSNYPSLHTSNKKYNNGSSFFSTTLSPDSDFCYLSVNKLTIINDQSCGDIARARLEEDPTLVKNAYGEDSYIHIYPESNKYQLILISTGDFSCTISESQMMWPGK